MVSQLEDLEGELADLESELERKQKVLNVMAPVLALLGAVLCSISIMYRFISIMHPEGYSPDPSLEFLAVDAFPPASLFFIGLLSWWLNRHHRTKLAGYVFTGGYGLTIFTYWLSVLLVSKVYDDLSSAYLIGLTILLAGVFVGGRTAIVTVFLLMGVRLPIFLRSLK